MPSDIPVQDQKISTGGHPQKAYLGIRNLMFHNEIVPGQKISYRELSERLQMSQTPIIQALKLLEVQQLVKYEPNRGYFTAPVNLQEVDQIYEMRELIEISLLPVTLKKFDDAGARRLQAALQAYLQASRRNRYFELLLKDLELHLTLASLSECEVQKQILSSLFDLLYLKYGYNVLFYNPMDTLESEHQALFESVIARDLKKAKRILKRHIRRVKKHALENLEQIAQSKRKNIF